MFSGLNYYYILPWTAFLLISFLPFCWSIVLIGEKNFYLGMSWILAHSLENDPQNPSKFLFNTLWFLCILAHSSYFSQGNVNIEKVPISTLPLICFRDGSPPLPDVNISLTDSGHPGTCHLGLDKFFKLMYTYIAILHACLCAFLLYLMFLCAVILHFWSTCTSKVFHKSQLDWYLTPPWFISFSPN